MMMNSPYEFLRQWQTNPRELLAKKYNIPEEICTPQGIIQHLLNTNQVSQEEVNRAMQMKQLIFKQK